MTRATLPGVAIRQQGEWPEPCGLGPLGQKGSLFDPHQTVALPAELQLDNLGAGHGIDPGQHLGAVAFAVHPLHGLLEAAFVDDEGICVGILDDADHPDALLKLRKFRKEGGHFSRQGAELADNAVCHGRGCLCWGRRILASRARGQQCATSRSRRLA